jgi:chorismate synthase
VAAGAIAAKFLKDQGIRVSAYIKQIGDVVATIQNRDLIYQSPVFCPDPHAANAMIALIEKAKLEGDSIGGLVEFSAEGVPSGLGDPIYEKLEANLAHAMMSIPASKGFEIGSGFAAVSMRGSEHNDIFTLKSGNVETETNESGGILGGISNGMPIIGRVAFKPTSSIKKAQQTLTKENEPAVFQLPEGSRHDPCVAIRAVPVVEAMVALVLVDCILLNRCVKR